MSLTFNTQLNLICFLYIMELCKTKNEALDISFVRSDLTNIYSEFRSHFNPDLKH